jgi:signal transduction histidine kinase
VAGQGRHRPVRAGRRQPGGQCARRDAGGRRPDDSHAQRRRRECRSFGYRELVDGDYVLVEVEDTGTGIEPEC